MSRNRNKIALCLAAFGVALVAGELLVRVLQVAPAVKAIQLASESCVYRRSPNPILGFELKSDYRNAAPDLIASYERTNSHGQRDVERTLEKPTGTRRIVLLGDSVVEGYGLAAENTISAQLQALSPATIEVLNFGVSAYCTLAEIELLATKAVNFAPDDVVLVFVENDFDNFNREAFPLGGTIQRPRIVEFLFKNSVLFRMICLQTNWFQFRSEAAPVEWNQQAIGDNNVAVGLARFRQLADEYGFAPQIAIWPRFQDDGVTDIHFVDPESSDPVRPLIVEVLAAKHGLPTFRLSKHFQAESQATPGNARLLYTQGDQLHPNAKGAQIAAEAIQKALSQPGTTPTSDSANLLDALESAKKLGQSKADYARVFNRIGDRHVKRGEYELAIVQYEKALAEDPQSAVTHNNLGVAKEQSGRDDANQHFIQAVQLQPDFALAHYNLSRRLLRENRTQAAMLGLSQTLLLDPNHVGALNLLAREKAKQGETAAAKRLLVQAQGLAPRNAEVLNNLGVVEMALGDAAQAATCFQAALAADPEHARAALNLKNLGQNRVNSAE